MLASKVEASDVIHPIPTSMTTTDRPKVVVLTEIIAPYRIPVFNEIAKDERLDFSVIFLAETASVRKWRVTKENMKFVYHISRGIALTSSNGFPLFFNPGVFWKLWKISPCTIICGGYQHPSFLLAALYAKWFRRRFILWCESHAQSISIRHPLAMFYRKLLIKLSSGYIVPGKLAGDFMRSLDSGRKPAYTAPNAVDNEFFSFSSLKVAAQKARYKKERGFPKYLILFVGRLDHNKKLKVLLDAFRELKNRRETGLIIVGDGPQEKEYQRYCLDHNLEHVYFEGFKQQQELPFYYGISDLLVLPSFRDTWGLVLNEAMACRLPVIASETVGGAYDLIEHGENGYRFALGNVGELRDRLDHILGDDVLRHRMGERSYEIIQYYSPRRCAEGFFDAIFGGSFLCRA